MSNYSSQNRLLALEKELYRWKQAPQNEQIYQVTQDEPELGDTLETIEENLDGINIDEIDEEFEQSNQEYSAPLSYRDIDEFVKMDNLSYSGLASVLSSNASQRFNRNIAQLYTQEDELAPNYLDIEKPIKQPTAKSTKPTLELPQIELPEVDSMEFGFVSDTTFSDTEPSYSSLLQSLQEARLNNFADSEEKTENQA
ncbi:hypothetical protein CAL7716_093130 [Calothrix sp. PCC 7716]|nr:hypothetical protein CAL7716_093130 [Calothrix sp. PCC 7716]